MASLQCIKPDLVTPKTVSNKRLKYGRQISVPCGKCGACLRRKSRCMAGKVLMELLWTRMQYQSEGFVWLLTLTYDPEKCSHYWQEPKPHDLVDMWKPWMVNKRIRYGRDSAARQENLEQLQADPYRTRNPVDKRLDVYWWLRRQSHSKKQIESYESGDYPRAKSLVRRDVKLWLLRCRQELGYQPRIAYSGEYGDDQDADKNFIPLHIESGNRPHYHVVVMGAPRSDIEKMARQWKLGNVDPNPHTEAGRTGFDRQQNEAGNASGKIAGYLAGHTQAKLARSSTLLSGRAPEFTQGSQSPALGDRYIIDDLMPHYAKHAARMLAQPFNSADELVVAERRAAMWVTAGTRWIKLEGGAYPLTERHKQMIRDACQGISRKPGTTARSLLCSPSKSRLRSNQATTPVHKMTGKKKSPSAKTNSKSAKKEVR